MFEGFYILWFVGQLLFGFIGGWMLAIYRMGEESTLSFCIDAVKEQPITSLVLLIFLPILTIEAIFLNVFIDVVMVLLAIITFVLHLATEIKEVELIEDDETITMYYCEPDDVNTLVNEIENDVNKILEKIEEFDIKEAKEMLEELADKLY